MRLSTELVAVTTAITLRKVPVEDRTLRSQVANHEARINALGKQRAS